MDDRAVKYLVLERRGHPPLTLFGVTVTELAIEAGAFTSPASVRARSRFKYENRVYILPTRIELGETHLRVQPLRLEAVRGQ